MPDSLDRDTSIKSSVKNICKDLTAEYTKKMVKKAFKQALEMKGEALADQLDRAWNSASKQDRDKYISQLEEKISQKISEGLWDEKDLLKEVSDILDKEIDPANIPNADQSPDGCKSNDKKPSPRKKPPLSYLPIGIVASGLIIAAVYLLLPLISPAQLMVSPVMLDFGVIEENVSRQLSFSITNSGYERLSWKVYADNDWMSLSRNSGTDSGIVYVSISGARSLGVHEGIIHVQSNKGSYDVSVKLRVKSPPNMSISPPTLDFTKTVQGIATGKFLNISNLGDKTLFWTAESNESWIDLIVREGYNGTQVPVGIKGDLEPGSYSGAINVRSNDKNIVIPVTLKVNAPARLAVSPDPLNLSFPTDMTKPPESQTIKMTNSGDEVLDWRISTENPWIIITPVSSGQLEEGRSQELSIGIDTANLDSIELVGTFMITSNGGEREGRVEFRRFEYLEVMPYPALQDRVYNLQPYANYSAIAPSSPNVSIR
jgi:hypothetical protein